MRRMLVREMDIIMTNMKTITQSPTSPDFEQLNGMNLSSDHQSLLNLYHAYYAMHRMLGGNNRDLSTPV